MYRAGFHLKLEREPAQPVECQAAKKKACGLCLVSNFIIREQREQSCSELCWSVCECQSVMSCHVYT